jgi:hypothetical protein
LILPVSLNAVEIPIHHSILLLLSEAEEYLSDANQSYQTSDYLTALYKIAFAAERSKSIDITCIIKCS